MTYQVETDLKKAARAAGLTARDLAGALNEPPSTTASRLNGFAPLSAEQRRIIVATIQQAKIQKSAEAKPQE